MAILKGEGAQLLLNGNVVGKQLTINGPNSTVAAIETTTHDSEQKEYRAGLFDPGTLDCEFQWDPLDTQHQGLETAFVNGTTGTWQVRYSNGLTSRSFDAFIASMNTQNVAVEGTVTIAMTLQLTGSITRQYSQAWSE